MSVKIVSLLKKMRNHKAFILYQLGRIVQPLQNIVHFDIMKPKILLGIVGFLLALTYSSNLPKLLSSNTVFTKPQKQELEVITKKHKYFEIISTIIEDLKKFYHNLNQTSTF